MDFWRTICPPARDRHPRQSLSRDQTQRGLGNGKTKIYTAIGFGPGSPPDDEETIYQATGRAFQAGANGIAVSREYEEMRVPNLKAVGRAVRELAK